jgi:hypothetical protein
MASIEKRQVMAIPKNKSRLIEIHGQRFRWCANQRGVIGDLTVACQHESGQGAILLVRMQHTDPWYRISIETGRCDRADLPMPNELLAVTPSFVRSAILFGLAVGWDSSLDGGQVVLRYEGGAFHPE